MEKKQQRRPTLKAIAVNGLVTLALSWSIFVCAWERLGIWQNSRYSNYRSEMVAVAGAILGAFVVFFIAGRIRRRDDPRFRNHRTDLP